jgi:glucokinase
MQQLIAGVDIGGTHITVGLVDTEKGELLPNTIVRAHIDPSLGKDEIIGAWCDAVRKSFTAIDVPATRIGIAMPGPFDYDNGISYITGLHKYESLYGVNVKEMMADVLDIDATDILMLNDASAFLFGELSCGAGKGYENLVGITLGTGLGSASYFDNKLHEGDLWSMPFKDARAEDHVCARWLVSAYEYFAEEKVDGVKEIAERFNSDDHAKKVFGMFGRNLAETLIKRYKEQSPELVVIGGNISKAWNCFIPTVRHVFELNNIDFELKPAILGEEAALIGGACLWKGNV